MEKFTAVIKSIHATDKSRNIKITAWDQWEAHKLATNKYHQYREDIISIKDSRNNEVYNLEKGFIFES